MILSDGIGWVEIVAIGNGRARVTSRARGDKLLVPNSPCTTAYPEPLLRLIFEAYGSIYTCNEISREIDMAEADADVRYSYFSYFDDAHASRPMNVLDYGCGGGASSVTLARMLPNSSIVGCDIGEKSLAVARARAAHHGLSQLSFHSVDASGILPQVARSFDLVFLNAVYEHLMPAERPAVLANVWRALKPGGSLILNQTPHRWFPVEAHTSGLPLINYLPDSVAHVLTKRFSRRATAQADWPQQLRMGIRGGTPREVVSQLDGVGEGQALLLAPVRFATCWAGIWYVAKRERIDRVQSSWRRAAFRLTDRLVNGLRLPFAPYMNIAVRKSS